MGERQFETIQEYEKDGRGCYIRLLPTLRKRRPGPAWARIPPGLAERLFFLCHSPRNGEPFLLPRAPTAELLDVIISYYGGTSGAR